MEKIKKILMFVAIVVFAVVAVFWFMDSDIKHIEDTNGEDNYKLQTISDSEIINMSVGAKGLKKSTGRISNTTTYSSNKFTGVEQIYMTNIVANRMEFNVNHVRVDSGNFKMVLVVNDKIVHEFKLNELMQTYVLEDVKGTVSLMIAGESADFQFDYTVI